MKLPLFQVDAFTHEALSGNPAAVVVLDAWLPDAVLQAIAAENNLSETAFLVPDRPGRFHLRWFTPSTEVDLCGHATLAAAWVCFHRLGESAAQLVFSTRSGPMPVRRAGDRLQLDFPARPGIRLPSPDPMLSQALGLAAEDIRAIVQARDTLVAVANADLVRTLEPDMQQLARLDTFGVIVTAAGESCDFVSRFFAPAQGVDEDPVTGSAHCTLAPYWAAQLGKNRLHARQVSRRGGELWCELDGDRVHISGTARCVIEGVLYPQGTDPQENPRES